MFSYILFESGITCHFHFFLIVFVSIAAQVGKVSWQSGAKEFHKITVNLAAYSLLQGKVSPMQV